MHPRYLRFTSLAPVVASIAFALPVPIASAQDNPGALFKPAMAYDSARQNIVLYGGQFRDESVSGETWVWDGATWTLAATTGPGARYGHAMAFDESRGKVVLFGGQGETDKGCCVGRYDTWEWNGSEWKLVDENLGSSSWYPVMAYDAANQTILMATYQDTWAWDGTTWTGFEDEHTPDLFRAPAMAFDKARETTVLVTDEGTWEWNGVRWNRASSTPVPTSLYGDTEDFAMAFDEAGSQMLLFGGREQRTMVLPILYPRLIWYLLYDRALDDTLSRRSGNWRTVNDPCPGPRFGHAMAFDIDREVAVVYGGQRVNGLYVAICDNFLQNCLFEIEQSVDSWDGACSDELPDSWGDDTWEWDGRSWNLVHDGVVANVVGASADSVTNHAATLQDATRSNRQLVDELTAVIDRCTQASIREFDDVDECIRDGVTPLLNQVLERLLPARDKKRNNGSISPRR